MCDFVAHLADQGLCHRTIKTYLSGLRFAHIRSGFPDPFQAGQMPRLEYVLRGIRKEETKNGRVVRERLPITPVSLRQLKGRWAAHGSDRDSKMLWAACCLAFFAFLRVGEMTVPDDSSYDCQVHLSFGDIAIDDPKCPTFVRLTLKQSKTDPFRKGIDLFVGQTGAELCPVAALLDYMCARGAQPGPLFMYGDGRPLTRKRFVEEIREALKGAGIDEKKYCSHSFRIGAATTAASKGLEDSVIKTLGRWESSAYLLYLRLPRDSLAGYSSLLAVP